jgi:hypothetical protein
MPIQAKVGWRSGATAPVVSVSTLLDAYSGAAAAYSLRKLSSTYTGSAIRVRRSSDNTELNIGFDANGDLDTYSLSAFVGTGNGFVTTWYDQSGNDRNATQATAANQPSIVSSGIVINLNNKSSIYFNGSTFMSTTQNVVSAGSGGYSVFGLGRPGGSPNCLFYIGSSTGNNGVGLNNNNGTPRHYWFANDYDSGQTFVNTNSIFVISYDGTKRYTTINNVTTSANSSGKNTTNPTLSIGRLPGYSQNLVGYESELVIYDLNKESIRTNITNDINSYYSVYPNPTSVWNLLTAVYNADATGSSSLKTSLFAAYNGESNANDSFGTNNGTAVGGLTYTTGKIGNAFDFNGTNSYISIPNTSGQLDFTGDFSISTWVMPLVTSAGYVLYFSNFLSSGSGYNFYLDRTNNTLQLYMAGGGNYSRYEYSWAPLVNTWYHLVLTRKGSTGTKFYINGTEAVGTYSGLGATFNPSFQSGQIYNIGSTLNGSGLANYRQDATTLWQKELTISEITELYNSGNGAQYIGDNFYKPTTNDALNTYNGTAQGGLTYGLGKVGTAFQFNGTNAHVSFPAGSFNSLTTNFSVSAWVYLPIGYTSANYCPIFSNMSAPGWFEVPGGFWLMFAGTTIQLAIGGKLNPTFLNYNISSDNLLGTWIHVVAVRKNNTSNKIYINNVLKASYTNTNPASLVNPVYYTGVNLTTPTIGNVKMPNGVQNGYYAYNGSKIDAVGIWNKELSASEVTELYNSGNGKQYPN